MSRFSRQRVLNIIASETEKITGSTGITPETNPAGLKAASEFMALGQLIALKALSDVIGFRAADSVCAEPTQTTGLDGETRETVDTVTAARYLNKQPGTLRRWSSQKHDKAPIRPAGKIGVDLAWRVDDLRAFANGKCFRPLSRRDAASETSA